MARNEDSATPPNLNELFQRYLANQVAAHEAGVGFAEATGEVTPYQAATAQPVEPRLAWKETLLVLQQFEPNVPELLTAAPPEWPNAVAMLPPALALTFSAGNYPQLVRNLQPLLQATRLSELRDRNGSLGIELPALSDWATEAGRKGQFPRMLLAVGVLRLLKRFDQAGDLIRLTADVPAPWRAAWDNECAALAWQRGDIQKAEQLWLSQSASVPVSFNRGMAALFADRPAEAGTALNQVVAQLPERSGWHHLARLYLALAEARSA